MKKISLIICTFLASLSFAQCSLEISDTTHINCNGDDSGALGLSVLNVVQPYTINLSNGAVAVNGNSFSGLTAGTYQLILLDANLCSDTIEIKLKEPSSLNLNIKCEANDLVAEVSGGVGPYSYFWKDASNTIFSLDSLVDFNPNQFYDFEVIDNKGCQLADSVFLSIDFSVNKYIGDAPLTIEVFNESSFGDCYWDFGDSESSTSINPIHEYENVGDYDLSLTLTDEHQCSSSKIVLIEVQGFDLAKNDWEDMPNAFSPNGDGINDSFTFKENNAIEVFNVKIYNRWGMLVNDWADPNFEWKGTTSKGDILAHGVYYYNMTAVGINGKSYEKKGSISIYY